MAPIRKPQAHLREGYARIANLKRVIESDEPEIAADLRSIWPALPAQWTHVESYCTDAFVGDGEVHMFQVWLCGETGELLIEVTQAHHDNPLMYVALDETTGASLYAEGKDTLAQDRDRVLAVVHKLHVKHTIPVPVHWNQAPDGQSA